MPWKLETVNPCSPYRVSPDAWTGVLDLCKRVGLDDDHAQRVCRELKDQHSRAGEWNMAEVKSCTNNLLKYYHDRLAADKSKSREPDFPLANTFATLVFSLHLASAVIETYFSKTKYTKNSYRSRLSDDLSSATLHLQQMKGYDDDEVLEPASKLCIDFQRALRRVENSIDDMRRRYMGARVKKPFYDPDLEGIREFGGEVTEVNWYSNGGCVLFKVSYDSDSDEEEFEHWELKKYVV